jgi:S1-C subfamily serine protease
MIAGEIWGKDIKPYFGILADVEVKNQVKIAQIHNGSPAEKAELKQGDVILKFNDVVIDSFDSLSKQVRKSHANELVEVEVKRGEETVHKTVKILQAPSGR